ncbi:hypothetical protein TNCV_986481 [Trichonephila clavipes]|uniref:Uncharacterized protein n=1 Tax=Trichonephila clavipes TaxID=2585209 RepID=A0A8X6SKH8_TRICX|nr:hypothetical protein TNCV_986481 [Trichonephila clavipes]
MALGGSLPQINLGVQGVTQGWSSQVEAKLRLANEGKSGSTTTDISIRTAVAHRSSQQKAKTERLSKQMLQNLSRHYQLSTVWSTNLCPTKPFTDYY